MPLVREIAFVVDFYDYKDRDRIAVLFSENHGLVRAAAKGARARMSRFSGAIEIMNEIEATWFESEGKEVVSLRELKLLSSLFPAVEREPEVAAVAAFAADHFRTFGADRHLDAALFRLARHLRDNLLAGSPPALAAVYVEVWALKLAGVFPRLENCGVCTGDLVPRVGEGEVARDGAGHLLCEGCRSRRSGFFSADAGRALRAILARPLGELGPLAEARVELDEISGLASDVRIAFLGRELQSAVPMRAILAG